MEAVEFDAGQMNAWLAGVRQALDEFSTPAISRWLRGGRQQPAKAPIRSEPVSEVRILPLSANSREACLVSEEAKAVG